MKCSEFEHQLELVTDVESRAVGSRHEVLDHAASCCSCSARLRQEELLDWSFGEIGAEVRQVSPSTEIEQRVMAAFDRECQGNQRHSRNWRRFATAAIAAVLLLIATASFALLRRQPGSSAQVDRSTIDLSAAIATVEVAQTMRPEEVNAKPRVRKSRPARHPVSDAAGRFEVPTEIATDFIRINYATPIEPGSQIVRVRLPRSAMAQFGLPVNMDRADQTVKADVIMGIDGIAQAIRFVQ
jgi:hypothetical protein